MFTLKHHLNFGPNFSRSNFCDAKLTTKHVIGCIPVHRIILSAVSKKLGKKFQDNLDGTEPIVINNVDFDVLEKIINYVYTGRVTFANDAEYEDFSDGISILKIEVGSEDKISPEDSTFVFDTNIVKMECEEEYEGQDTSPNKSASVNLMTQPPSAISDSLMSGTALNCDSATLKVDICHSEDKDSNKNFVSEFHLSPPRTPSVELLLASTAIAWNEIIIPLGTPCTPNKSSDINDNPNINIRKDLYKAMDNLSDEIEILHSKQPVELFLEELSKRVSGSQLKNYFSPIGEVTNVDLMEHDYAVNSGLAIVKILINEENKRKLSEMSHKIKNLHFKVLFKEETVADYHSRLDKRIGDNRSKLRLKGISQDITAHDIREFFVRRNAKFCEVIVEGENGYVDFLKFGTANEWNGENICVKGASIKIYRSWKDSSRTWPKSSIRSRSRERKGRYRR